MQRINHAATPVTLASLLALAALSGTAIAQPCETQVKLLGSSPTAGDQFGSGVSMSFGGPNNRPLMAVGKPGEDSPAGADAGGWSVWQLNTNGTWSMAYDAWNAAGQAGERAGTAISISDPYMIVGAPRWENRGRARLLQRQSGSNTWLVIDDFNPGLVSGSFQARYGNAVAISAYDGGWAIVGSPFFSLTHADSGSVYTYQRNQTTNQWLNALLIEGGSYLGQVGGQRGRSVAISQTSPWAAFGAPGETSDSAFADDGAAYVVQKGSTSAQLILPPVQEAGQGFGKAVAVEGNWLAVGASDEDGSSAETGLATNLVDSGAVYMFERANGTWFYRATLRSPTPTQSARFGNTLAMSDTQLVVSELFSQRTHVYRRDGNAWKLQSTFRNPEPDTRYGYSQAAAVYGGEVAIGDLYNQSSSLVDTGAVYTASVAPTMVNGDLCSDPIPMPTSNFVGCTTTATPSIGTVTTCGLGGGGQGNDVWFRFSPTCDGNAIIDTLGSDFDTVLSVHSDCPTLQGGNTIVCNDDASFAAPNNRNSLVTFNFQGGSTYLVRVTGYNRAEGQFTLRSLMSYGVNNDNCSTASTVAAGTYTFNTCSATTSSSGGVPLGSDRDVWYRFIAPAAGEYSFGTCGSSFDTVVTLFNGTQQNCPSSAAQMITQNDDSVGFCNPSGTSRQSRALVQLTQGQSVMLRVGGANATAYGPGTLRIAHIDQCDSIDFNNDGLFPDDNDLVDFLAVLAGGTCSNDPACNDIDFNNDGLFPDDNDLISYLRLLAGGSC